ncbi:MAG: serine hydrolase [Vicingaceae bacterium]
MKIKKPSLILALLVLPFAALKAQHTKFDNYVASAVEDFELPALAISVVSDDSVLFQKAYGYANLPEKQKAELESVFAIASISKAFTATCIGMLVDDGKLNWNDRVQEYLPYFRLSDEYVASQMTIEDLLCHRSGFKTFDGDLLWYMTDYEPKEIVERFQHYQLNYDHRTQYGYQNIMFITAGLVVEAASGMKLEDFMKQRIFEPLQMSSTYTSIEQYTADTKVAMPHVKGELDELRNYDNSAGAALISSNVIDMSKWIQFWLNDGIVDNDTLLSASTYKKLLEMHTPIPTSGFDAMANVEFKGYALGWFLINYQGHKVAHHGGGLPGYISKIFLVPSENLGGIILTNGETSLPTALMLNSIDEFEDKKEKPDWAGTILKFSKSYEKRKEAKKEERYSKRNAKLKPNLSEEKIKGSYEDTYYGEAVVSEEKGQLNLKLLPAKKYFSSPMEHWQQNTYKVKFKDGFLPEGFVTFQANADGEVTHFTIDLPNPDFHFYNLNFEKKK